MYEQYAMQMQVGHLRAQCCFIEINELKLIDTNR